MNIKGLNDYLYDIQREREQMLDGAQKQSWNFDLNDDLNDLNKNINNNTRKGDDLFDDPFPKGIDPNVYYLVNSSQMLECYVINREAYLKNMFAFTTDKSLINKYLDQLVYSLILYFIKTT